MEILQQKNQNNNTNIKNEPQAFKSDQNLNISKDKNNDKIQVECLQCKKKTTLINKYLQLIQLLRKKAKKCNDSLNSFQSKKSNIDIGSTTVNTKILYQNHFQYLQKSNLPFALTKSVNQNIKNIFFAIFQYNNHPSQINYHNQKQLSLIVIKNRYQSCHLRQGFNNLKRTIFKQQNHLKESFQIYKNDKDFQKNTNLITKIMSLNDRNNTLQKQNKSLCQKINLLELQIKQIKRVQLRDNQKKKASLQMLGQDLQQKIQTIEQLQGVIQKLQKILNSNIKSCDSKIIIYQKQILSQQNKKLKLEVQKLNQKVQQLQQKQKILEIQLEQVKQKLNILQNEMINKTVQLNRSIRNIKYMNQVIQNKNQTLQNYIRFVNVKLRQINILKRFFQAKIIQFQQVQIKNESYNLFKIKSQFYQKLSQLQKQLINGQQNHIDLLSNIHVLYNNVQCKVYSLISFLSNVISDTNQLSCQSLFTQNQIEIILFSKANIKQYLQSLDKKQKQLNNQLKKQTNLKKKQSQTSLKVQNERSSRSGQQSITFQLIQMEIQKNKQIQKTLQMKSTLMHIRQLVLNLLQSLQINEHYKLLNSKVQGILSVIFEIFQYSQDQKQKMLGQTLEKKNKIFGLF